MEDAQHKVTALTVYKASAGSGKTFTLASEYIKLLIDNTHSFERILAVTFTNKATNEMKTRILSQLYGIAHNLPDSADYTNKVCKELNISKETAAEKADEALHLLLHNYNLFRVQTIDTFFQSVLRNLAKELSLSNNMRISLNDEQVIGQAVDNLIETMSVNKELMSWIDEYVNEKMDEDKSWNIADEIKGFGKNITKEFYKTHSKLLSDAFAAPNFFTNYKKKLTAIRKEIHDRYKSIGDAFTSILNENGLDISDLSRGSGGPASYFLRLKRDEFDDSDKYINKYVKDALEDYSKWHTAKSAQKELIERLAEQHFVPMILKAEKTRLADTCMSNSIVKTLKNMNKLRLLHSIEEEIIQENGEHSRFMLSDTQALLHEMIGEDHSIAPFIFEKIGSHIKHIMIDEFQDTSKTQWKNFKVLLEECMAETVYQPEDKRIVTNNLIVGDVKQSIYRFRSGDWELLNNIGNQFNNSSTHITSLQTNYRSERNIIDFNNSFFKIAAEIEAKRIEVYNQEWADNLRKAYSDVSQSIPDGRESTGLVRVHLHKGSDKALTEVIIEEIVDTISTLVSQGTKLESIAILVRNNKHIPLIASYFASHNVPYNLISEEAFRLDFSPAVQMIVCAMKLIADPKDTEPRAKLAKYYYNIAKNNSNSFVDDNQLLVNRDKLENYLPPFINESEAIDELLSMPLSEMAEQLLRYMNLGDIEGQSIYISTFFDFLANFCDENNATLEDFIDYWEEDLCGKTVAVGNIDGIRIMSLHKSKGLEFDTVILPFCNWQIGTPVTETLWCDIKEAPFNELPFIPVDYKNHNSLKDSIYQDYGYKESMQEIVDNLNLLYVGFTRAAKNLFVFGGNSNDTCRSSLISNTLQAMYENGNDMELIVSEEGKTIDFTFGSLCIKDKKEKLSDNVFLQKADNIDVTAKSFKNDSVEFRQSNKSNDFADDSTDDADKLRFIHNGTILHQIFSSINDIDDIDTALRQLEFEGVLYNEDTTPSMLREELSGKFNNPQVADWFSKRWQVYNECTIICRGNDGKAYELRPDRVISDGKDTIVIDYKFGRPEPEHEHQVRAYIKQLDKLNMPNVKGFIWYVNQNKIHEIIS